jgi:hypothetical protein
MKNKELRQNNINNSLRLLLAFVALGGAAACGSVNSEKDEDTLRPVPSSGTLGQSEHEIALTEDPNVSLVKEGIQMTPTPGTEGVNLLGDAGPNVIGGINPEITTNENTWPVD